MYKRQDYDNPGSLSKQWFLGMEPIFANENGDSKYPGGPMFNMFSLGQVRPAEGSRPSPRLLTLAQCVCLATCSDL